MKDALQDVRYREEPVKCLGANPRQSRRPVLAIVTTDTRTGERQTVECPQLYTNSAGERCCMLAVRGNGNLCVNDSPGFQYSPVVITGEVPSR